MQPLPQHLRQRKLSAAQISWVAWGWRVWYEQAAHSAAKWVSLKACFLLPSPIQASSCPTSPKTSLTLQGGYHHFTYSSASLHTQHRLLPRPSETPLGHTGSDLPLNYSLPGSILFNCTGLQPINHSSPTCKHFCESLIV